MPLGEQACWLFCQSGLNQGAAHRVQGWRWARGQKVKGYQNSVIQLHLREPVKVVSKDAVKYVRVGCRPPPPARHWQGRTLKGELRTATQRKYCFSWRLKFSRGRPEADQRHVGPLQAKTIKKFRLVSSVTTRL